MNVDKLLRMKEEIEEAKNKKNRLEGQLETEMKALEAFGCTSIEEAEVKLKELETKMKKSSDKLEKAMEKLEEAYDWKTV